MIIDKEQLIALLVDKTGLGEDEVEEQLSKLIERVNQAAQEGKSFEIEGFGTFGMEDGVLEFTPADRLQTEVNNKYAGMKPIELIGAFKEPEEDEIPDIIENAPKNSEKTWAFDEDAAQDKSEEELVEAEQEQSKDVIEEVPEQKTSSEEAQEEFEELINEDSTVGSSEEEMVSEEKEQQKQEPVAVEEADERDSSETKEEADPIGRILVTAVIVIAVGFTGFLMYDFGVFEKNNVPAAVSENQSSQQSQLMGEKQATANENEDSQISSEPDQPEEVTNPEGNSESSDPQQPAYGLKGTVNASVSNGYMIVVHSLRNQQQAETRKEELVAEGYRALINEATVQGAAYYRVGIGQFSSVEAAQDAADDIPEPYRSNNFIKRIK